MDGDLVFLLNPPSPSGVTVNREGAGGLGVVVPGSRGFVYPAHRLGEAARWLRRRGQRTEAADLVLAPRRGRWRLRRLSRAAAVLAHVSRASLESDLAYLSALRQRHSSLRFHVSGVALAGVADRIADALPGVTVDQAISGFGAAAHLLGEDEAAVEQEGRLFGADFSRLPLGRGRRVSIHHGRGCTFSCSYCPYVVATGRRHLLRPAEVVLQDFVSSVRAYRPRRIVFRDPVFGLVREATLELLGWIAALPREQRVPFEIESRPELLRDGMIEALVAAGCVEIKLGVETLEARALVATRRVDDAAAAAAYREAVAEVMREGAERGLTVRAFLLEGLEGSSPEGDRASAKLLSGHEPLVTKQVVPVPGGSPPA